MKTVQLDKDAEAEFIDAVAWYEAQEEGVGRRFFVAITAAIDSLPRRRLEPLTGFKDRGAKYVYVSKPWPYRLFVVERGDLIHVIAVAHHGRAPGYWLERLPR